MKKLFILMCLMIAAAMGSILWKNQKNLETEEIVDVPEIEPFVSDKVVISQQQIDLWIKNNDIISDYLDVELKDDGVEATLIMEEELLNLVEVGNAVREVMRIFEGEKLSCRFNFSQYNLEIEKCSIGSLVIPESIYEDSLIELNERIPDLMNQYGIEDIAVFDESIQIKGDISETLESIVNKRIE